MAPEPRDIERIYAHFHRVLADLLTQLEQDTDTTWLTDERHQLSGDYVRNSYAPAVYVTDTLEKWADQLRELDDVQAEALETAGRSRPGRNLLPPLTADGVTHVRISRHEGQTGRTVEPEAALRRLAQIEEQTVANLKRFEDHYTRFDPGRKRVEKELTDIRQAAALLREAGPVRLRETYAQTVIRPYLYFADGSSRQLHMRQTGLLVAGPKPEVSWRTGPRLTRSDKIDIPPLVQAGRLTFYNADDWEEARTKTAGPKPAEDKR